MLPRRSLRGRCGVASSRQAQRPAGDIESIRVGVTAPGYQMVCTPEHVRRAPRTIVEAQFSILHGGGAWIDGGLAMRHFSDEGVQRADVLDLASRVQPYVDAEIDRDWSRFVTPARVIVRFRDGKTIEERVDYPKGHPKNMMTEANSRPRRGIAQRLLPRRCRRTRLTACSRLRPGSSRLQMSPSSCAS